MFLVTRLRSPDELYVKPGLLEIHVTTFRLSSKLVRIPHTFLVVTRWLMCHIS